MCIGNMRSLSPNQDQLKKTLMRSRNEHWMELFEKPAAGRR